MSEKVEQLLQIRTLLYICTKVATMRPVETYEISQTLLSSQKGCFHDERPDGYGTKQDTSI